jgi:hypothetical protein
MRDLPRSPAAVERAAALAGPDATVQAVRALAGGTHARTWLIRTANPELEVVVREFPFSALVNQMPVLAPFGMAFRLVDADLVCARAYFLAIHQAERSPRSPMAPRTPRTTE